jgi:NTE family protein
MSSGGKVQTAGAEPRQERRTGRQQRPRGRRTNRQERRTKQHPAPRRHKVALALQGGGSHGAYTWGVLDRLLDDTTIDIIGVSETSAGAVNGAVLVNGLVRGGPKQASAEIRQYWEAVGAIPGFGSFFSGISGEEAATTPLENIPAYVERMRQSLSPYDLSPSHSTPLRPLLTELIDFNRLRLEEEIQLTVCATNPRTAKRRVFTNQDVSIDALLASACLPHLFPAVEIDGEPYWDGGFTGNPALIRCCQDAPNARELNRCPFRFISMQHSLILLGAGR